LKKLEEAGLKRIRIEEEDLIGKFLAKDVVDMSSGIVLAEAGDEITQDFLTVAEQNELKALDILRIDNVNYSANLRNTVSG
jgi:DNA-directed RNA polymerase subunit beta